jgi:hypothetical protein
LNIILNIKLEECLICRKLEGQKILATTSNKWVGSEENPMIADNRELEKMFEKKDLVNFVIMEDKTPQPRAGGRVVLGTSLFDSHREIHAIFLLSESL